MSATAATQQTSLGRDLGDLVHNGPWLILGVVGICANTWAVLKMASLVYFFKYYIGNEPAVAPFMLVGHRSATCVGVVATGWMTKYLGKKNLYIVATIVNIVTTAAYFFAGPEDMVFLYAMNIIGGFASGPVSPLIWALYADTADYSEWKTGRRATGLIFSAGTFAQKMGWTIGGIAGRPTCSPSTASRPTSRRPPSSLLGIRLLVSLIPAVGRVPGDGGHRSSTASTRSCSSRSPATWPSAVRRRRPRPHGRLSGGELERRR